MRGLQNKYAIVTGAAKGIGKGIARRFAGEGVHVLIADILAEGAEKTAAEIREEFGVTAIAYPIDLTKNEEIEAMMAYAHDTFGSIDILVCNAGVTIHNWATDYPVETIDFVLNIDLRAHYLCARTAARYMKEQPTKGNVVCISSVNSAIYHSKRSLYNISKAGINGMVGTLGVEWARFGIRINAVAPGYVGTDLVNDLVAEGKLDLTNNMQVIPIKRLIEVEEIANTVAFLASDEASGITAQTIFVDGGWSKDALPEEKDIL